MKTTKSKVSAKAKEIGKSLCGIGSLISCATQYAGQLENWDETRSVAYPLAWAIGTGRADASLVVAVANMKPALLAQTAMDLAAKLGPFPSVATAWEAWKATLS